MKRLAIAIALALAIAAPAHAGEYSCEQPGSATDQLRKGFIALDISLEEAVLGRASNLTAEHEVARALLDAGEKEDWCRLHRIQDAELARQKASETPDEQERIAAYALEIAASLRKRLHPR